MAWFSDKKNTKALLKALSSEDKNKRNQAAREFLKLGEDGVETLLSALGSQDINLRKLAGQILIRLGGKAIPLMKKSFPGAPILVQENIIYILGNIKDEGAQDLLFNLLKGKDYKLQVLAAKSLGGSGDPRAIPHLLPVLSDSDPDVRIAVVGALARFRAAQTYVNIADLLDDAEINVRVASAKALGEIGASSTIPYLIDAMHDSFWWYGREDAIQTLLSVIASFGVDALEPLIEAMNGKESTVRRYAIGLLRPLKEPRIIESLEMAFYNTNYDVAETALDALLEFGEIVLPILAEALLSPNEWIREKAVWGLGEVGGEQAIANLLDILSGNDDAMRKEAILSLTKLKDPRTLPTLRSIALNRKDKEISKIARQAIAEIEAP